MYAFIKGILQDVDTDHIVIENNGIGYNVHIYSPDSMDLPDAGEEVFIHTYTSVAEDRFMLYGFLSKEELDLFKLLISVNGVGPKSAQAMLAVLGTDEIVSAILSEDIKTISKTPGLGAKTAGRLINDLKDKVGSYTGSMFRASLKKPLKASDPTPAMEECMQALISLGYSRGNAEKAVISVKGAATLTSEELLPEALKIILTI